MEVPANAPVLFKVKIAPTEELDRAYRKFARSNFLTWLSSMGYRKYSKDILDVDIRKKYERLMDGEDYWVDVR